MQSSLKNITQGLNTVKPLKQVVFYFVFSNECLYIAGPFSYRFIKLSNGYEAIVLQILRYSIMIN